MRAKMRQFIQNENEIRIFETDINEKEPYNVVEQECETKDERKFKAYYPSDLGGFSCYIFVNRWGDTPGFFISNDQKAPATGLRAT